MIGYIYLITNKINGKKYVGQTMNKDGYEKRWRQHKTDLKGGYHPNEHLQHAWDKYGEDNFEFKLLDTIKCKNKKILIHCIDQLEIFYIKHWNLLDDEYGYNLARGGSIDGEGNPMFGKKGKDNPASRSIVMISLEGKIIKEFDCIREANDYFNKPKASSIISNVCIDNKGTAYGYFWLFKEIYNEMIEDDSFKNWYKDMYDKYGKRYIKMNEANIMNNEKPIYKLNKNTLEIVQEYNSINLASKETNIRANGIKRNCLHGSNTAGGYSWIYKDEYESLSKEELIKLYSHKCSDEEYKKEMSKKKTGKMKGKENPISKSVICLTTKRIFWSTNEGAEYYSISNHIYDCCNGKLKSCGKLPDGTKLVWRYLVWNHGKNFRMINRED